MLQVIQKIGKGLLILVLTLAVLVGAYLGYSRYFMEIQNRTVELCVDFNDLKQIAAYENMSLDVILDSLRNKGIVSLGVFEETLPEASVLGEVYYARGSGVLRLKGHHPRFDALAEKCLIKTNPTYIYAPFDAVRKRIYNQLKWVLGKEKIDFLGRDVMEIDVAEEELRELGVGISESQKTIIRKKGFRIIPRIWNDSRYHLGNIGLKIAALGNYDTVIFEGEEILGYPAAIGALSSALKEQKIRYGFIEIVKQDGDSALKQLMGKDIVRVHSVPKGELKKLTKGEAVKRFVRAAKERNVRLIYLRPFMPPQVDAYPVAFNLNYFDSVKSGLEKAGFVLGKAESVVPREVKGWQITLLGTGVIISALFLLNYFIRIPLIWMYLILLLSVLGILYSGSVGYGTQLQKGLALLAAVTFPALAVISNLSKAKPAKALFWDPILVIFNVLGETFIGVFLLIGLLSDYRFMLGTQTFSGVKAALIFPIFIVALYFVLKLGEGSFKERVFAFLNKEIKLLVVFIGLFILAALGIFVARSGNFVLPVPILEKYFRDFLEVVLAVRPRTKEFLIGYPFLFFAAVSLLRGNQKWLWLFATIGTIAPISVFNTFCHVHTPLMISLARTVNGLVLGIIVGIIATLIAQRYIYIKE